MDFTRGGRLRCGRSRTSTYTVEKINESYVGRVLRLTLLAPDIIEAILGGRQPPQLQLEKLLRRLLVSGGSSVRKR
jgi:hypothetical protein